MNYSCYVDRLDHVVDYISKNLEGDLNLNTLADVACLSPYHWHRIYAAMCGETVHTTVKRLRLQHAAGKLANGEQSIKNIANKAGYSSPEAFSRSFKGLYLQSPEEFRKSGSHAKYKEAIVLGDNQRFSVSIESLRSTRYASLPHTGSYLQIGSAMGKVFGQLGSQELLNDKSRMVGVFYDDPDVVPGKELRSDACVSVSETDVLPNSLNELVLPSGTYAKLRYKGPYSDMKAAYKWLYGVWLPNSGYQAANHPPHEEYLNNPQEVSPTELLTDICLPLEDGDRCA